MQDDQTEFSRTQNDRELRAAVDVMFEALAHIQASINASESEAREKQYQMFKEALYERFEHLLEQQYAPDPSSDDPTASGEETPSGERLDRPPQDVGGDGAADLHSAAPSAPKGDAANGDALERAEEPADEANTLWPSS